MEGNTFLERVKKIVKQMKEYRGGFYNMLFGVNPNAPIILAALDLDLEKIGRFRDVWVEEDRIAIYTRLGAGNAKCWCDPEDVKNSPHPLDPEHASYCFVPNVKYLKKHPLYIGDEEDEFDSTYRTFYFKIPEKYKEILLQLKEKPRVNWEVIKEIGNMSMEELKEKYPELYEIAKMIADMVKEGE